MITTITINKISERTVEKSSNFWRTWLDSRCTSGLPGALHGSNFGRPVCEGSRCLCHARGNAGEDISYQIATTCGKFGVGHCALKVSDAAAKSRKDWMGEFPVLTGLLPTLAETISHLPANFPCRW